MVERHNTNSLKWDDLENRYGDSDLISMWVADMEFKTEDKILEAMIERIKHGVFGYSYIPDEYYKTFSNWMEKHYNCPVDKETIRFSTGVVTAISWCINAFTNPQDACLILTPVYYPFHNVVTNNERKLVTVDLINDNGYFSMDYEKIEEEIKQIFEGVRVLRLDKDTTSQKYEMENILNKFQNKEADILIGTQMISKGLDFKHVTLVGILSADMMLNFPDFKSFENTFQLVTQVSGRAGRSEKEGKVILQAYDTDSSVIKRIVNYDFDGFYEDEIKIRKLFNYTPFNNMISVVVSGKNEYMVKKNITNFYNTLVYLLKERGISDFDFILGPNPCSISKINSNYRWQILFKDDNIEINLLKGIIKYICITKRDVVFDKEVNISIDINPNSIL